MLEGGPPEQTPRRVLEPRPFEIALTEEHGVVADPSHRSAPGVFDHRAGRVDDPRSAQAGTVREVHIFVDHEEIFVEPADGFKERAPDEERGAADAEHVARRGGAGRRHPMKVFEAASGAQVAVAGRIDDLRRIHVHDLRCHQTNRRIRIGHIYERLQPAGPHTGVVVQEDEIVAAGTRGAGVVAARKPEIAIQSDDPHVRMRRSQEVGAAIRRPIVDDDPLARCDLLLPERAETAVQPSAAVPIHDDHADGHVTNPLVVRSLEPIAKSRGAVLSGPPTRGCRLRARGASASLAVARTSHSRAEAGEPRATDFATRS